MIVISLVNPPRSLHGDLTKWLQEVNTNVYVGNVNARIREALWERIIETIKTGQATMVYNTNNEQGFMVRVWGTTWKPVDFDGLILMQRPFPKENSDVHQNYLGKSKYSSRMRYKSSSHTISAATSFSEEFAVVDIETTGLNYKEDQIIEIGALICNYETILEKYSFLVKSSKPVSETIENLTGITQKDLDHSGISIDEALNRLSEIIGERKVVFHNSRFDLRFLVEAYKISSLKAPLWEIEDTLSLARKHLPSLPDHKLDTVCNHLQCVNRPFHRALSDCIATREAYTKLKNF